MWKYKVYRDISCSEDNVNVNIEAVLSSVSPTGPWHEVNVFFVCDFVCKLKEDIPLAS